MAILDELTPEVLALDAHLARIRPGIQMHHFDRGRRSQGQRYFRASNPPNGAIITYYLNPSVMQTSGDATNDAMSEGLLPKVEVDILGPGGELVRQLNPVQGHDGTGVQRLIWDLRHPLEFDLDPEEKIPFFRRVPQGPFVLPGDYRVRLRLGMEEKEQILQVRGDPIIELSDDERKLWHDTLQTLNQMWATVRAVVFTLQGLKTELEQARNALRETATPELVAEINALEKERSLLEKATKGKPMRSRAEQRGVLPIAELIPKLYANIEAVTALPTENQLRQTRESHKELARQVLQLNRFLGETFPAFRNQLDGAGVRWTPHRRIPMPQ